MDKKDFSNIEILRLETFNNMRYMWQILFYGSLINSCEK